MVTIALVAVNAIVFAILTARGVATPEAMVAAGGNYAPRTLGGEPWRLVTSVFLHNDLWHVVVNMLALLLLGTTAERWFGRAGFLTVYLLAGLAGALAIAAFEQGNGVGASGAVYGVFGAIGASLVLRRDRLGRAGPPLLLLAVLMIAGLAAGPASSMEGPVENPMTWAAHVTGLLAGVVLGAALAAGRPARRDRRAAQVGGLGLVAVVVALAVMPKPADEGARYAEVYRAYDEFGVEVGRAFERAATEFRAGRLDRAGFATAIAEDVVPLVRTIAARFRALPVPAPPYRDGHRAIVAYLDARLVALEAVVELLRGRRQDQETVEALRVEAEARLAAANAAVRAMPR